MTQEDKELLLKDLSARLLFGVKVTWDGKHPLTVTPHIYCAIVSEDNINNLPKLLLRPMSSMTEEEKEEFDNLYNWSCPNSKFLRTKIVDISELINWLNEHYFDYRGLIEKCLALEAPKEIYK